MKPEWENETFQARYPNLAGRMERMQKQADIRRYGNDENIYIWRF